MNIFEYNAKLTNGKEVSLDVVEWDQPQSTGIKVQELHFEDTGKFLAFIARETGRGP